MDAVYDADVKRMKMTRLDMGMLAHSNQSRSTSPNPESREDEGEDQEEAAAFHSRGMPCMHSMAALADAAASQAHRRDEMDDSPPLHNNSMQRGGTGRIHQHTSAATKASKKTWTEEEDRIVAQHVIQVGRPAKWSKCAALLPGRIGKNCRERWHNHLNPDIKKTPWSDEEDRKILALILTLTLT